MKNLILPFYLLILTFSLGAQNLVPNGSFEDLRNLPIKSNPVNNFEFENKSGNKAFIRNTNYWFSANRATPDLRVLDSIFLKKCNEKYDADCDSPRSGNHSVGIVTYMKGNKTEAYREYIQIKLLKPLRPKVKTHLEFWLSRERQAKLVSNNIGCYFSKNKVYADILTPILTTPQFNIDTIINKNGAAWIKIAGTIIPDKAYTFMTIGNFFDNKNTQLKETDAAYSNYSVTSAYYLIDDINVWQDTIIAEKEDLTFDHQTIEMDQPFELSAIHFKINSTILDASSYPILKELTAFLEEQKNLNLEVHGYTDSRGDANYNLKLSQARANRIQDYLVEQGIALDRLTTIGHGEKLAAENLSNEGHAANRKVLFVLRK